MKKNQSIGSTLGDPVHISSTTMSASPVKSDIYIQVLPRSCYIENVPGSWLFNMLIKQHHCFAVRGDMSSVESKFQKVERSGDGSYILSVCFEEGDGFFMGKVKVEKLWVALVDGQSYVCVVPASKQSFLVEGDFLQAITEANHLQMDVVCWHQHKTQYEFPAFHGVLKRKLMDQIVHRRFVKGVFEGAVETSNGYESISITFENGNLNQNRASKSALGTLEEILFSFTDGLNFKGDYEAQTSEFTMGTVKRVYKVSGAGTQANLIRCGSWIGASLANSDGFCGPDNGPACEKCKERQKAVPDRWEVEVEIRSFPHTTTVLVLASPCPEDEEDAGSSSKAQKKSTEDKPKSKRDGECVVCLDKPADYAAIPCGHKCVCKGCKEGVKSQCPCCRVQAAGWLRIFNV